MALLLEVLGGVEGEGIFDRVLVAGLVTGIGGEVTTGGVKVFWGGWTMTVRGGSSHSLKGSLSNPNLRTKIAMGPAAAAATTHDINVRSGLPLASCLGRLRAGRSDGTSGSSECIVSSVEETGTAKGSRSLGSTGTGVGTWGDTIAFFNSSS
jgi:hypothetical protein